MRKVLEILPTVTCVKPKDALSLMSLAVADSTKVVMDQKTFSSETFQRVYQYLRRHVANSNLDSFAFDHSSIEGTPHDCLQILLRLVRGTVFIIKIKVFSSDSVELRILHGQKYDTSSHFWTSSCSPVRGHISLTQNLLET